MTETLRSDIVVKLLGQYGGDADIADAARVISPEERDTVASDCEKDAKLIGSMMKHRHGSPFEHGYLSLYVETPIFVIREWQRHRHLSFNEVSARYRRLEPQFWMPSPSRPLIEGDGFKPMRPDHQTGTAEARRSVDIQMEGCYRRAATVYARMIDADVAREVARAVLPVGTYSAMVVSGNPRAWMHFVSLRTHDPDAAYVSWPQREIEDAGRQVEALLDTYWPATMAAFRAGGRVAP